MIRYRNYGGAMVPDPDGPWVLVATHDEAILRDVIRRVLDSNFGPMSYNAEVTNSILRAVMADAEFEPIIPVER